MRAFGYDEQCGGGRDCVQQKAENLEFMENGFAHKRRGSQVQPLFEFGRTGFGLVSLGQCPWGLSS